jgi:hypothetical protein
MSESRGNDAERATLTWCVHDGLGIGRFAPQALATSKYWVAFYGYDRPVTIMAANALLILPLPWQSKLRPYRRRPT